MTRVLSVLALVLLVFGVVFTTLPAVQASPELQLNYAKNSIVFTAITSTQQKCLAFPSADKVYVQLSADVTTVNTTSVATEFGNDGGFFTVGDVLSATVNADTPTLAVGNMYTVTNIGYSFCLRATVANTNPVTITANIFAPSRE